MMAGGPRPWGLATATAAILLTFTVSCSKDEPSVEAETSASSPRHEWCEVLESLELPDDAPDIQLNEVPVELKVVIQLLARNERAVDEQRRDETFPADVETPFAVEARTEIETWGQTHCGGPDPFCSLWTSLGELVGADGSRVQGQFAITALDDELLQYAPDELIDAVRDHLVVLHASLGKPVPSDFRQGDGEAAYAALDEWVRAHCQNRDAE